MNLGFIHENVTAIEQGVNNVKTRLVYLHEIDFSVTVYVSYHSAHVIPMGLLFFCSQPGGHTPNQFSRKMA